MRRQRPRGRQRIGASEDAVAEMHRAIRPEREALRQRLAGARRTHCHRHHLPAMRLPQLDPLQQRPHVEGTHLGAHPLAPQRLGRGIELQRRHDRDLLDTDDDPHGGRC